MSLKRVTASPFASLIEESLLSDLLEHVPLENREQALEFIVAILGIGIFSLCFTTLRSTRDKEMFCNDVPTLLASNLVLADFEKYHPELPHLVQEHIERTLLSLRTKLRN